MRRLTMGIGVLAGTQLFGSELPKREGNTFELRFPGGGGAVEWVSASTFRFSRNWKGREAARKPVTNEAIEVSVGDSGAAYRFRTRYLTVDVSKDGARVTVRSGEERLLDQAEVRHDGGGIIVEHPAAATERFYGLGSRRDAKLDLRGSLIETGDAFLISSEGYAEYYPASGVYRFDLASTRPNRRLVKAPGDRLEYFFYYGPTPKEILEEHFSVAGAVIEPATRDFEIRRSKAAAGAGSWETLRERVHELAHSSFSAKLFGEFDLAPFASGELPLYTRAAQLGSIVPVLYAAKAAGGAARERVYELLERRRARWLPYFLSYAAEARDRGIPLLRPLPLQSPEDAPAANRSELFMLGDEVLFAPVLNPGNSVAVYLPKGIWTDLRTNEIHKGRQEITVRATLEDMPAFARNGAILPLAAEQRGAPMELHYFPRLGAEFFLFEESDNDYSQFHAAPAGDLLRLEIESRVDRDYEWIVHHLGPCRAAAGSGIESWHYDKAANNLHVKVRGKPGADQVTNVSF